MIEPELHGDHTLTEAAAVRALYHSYGDNAVDWKAGSSEPWIADVVCELLHANNTRVAVEIGGFQGFMSKRMLQTLAQMPHDTNFTVCEIDHDRARDIFAVLETLPVVAKHRTRFQVVLGDSLQWIPTLADASVDFVWLDGNHEQAHVYAELHLLLPKMAPGGIIAGHDVFGVCRLNEVFEQVARETRWRSMSLDLPRLGPAGGIGLLQRPR